ncbi:recombinase RecT [Sutterella sp.]|uniref:recombinase RecT n=1 Tax=Sutterella sp. TaxID=1981025 RepID=UPI003FD8D75F
MTTETETTVAVAVQAPAPQAAAPHSTGTASTRTSVLARMAEKLQLDPAKLWKTLKATCFAGDFSDEEAALVLMVAESLDLNPLRREIWAFRGRSGVQPIVSIDGWKAIMLRQPTFDGFQVTYSETSIEIGGQKLPEWAECTIWIKGCSHPTCERVYLTEVYMPKSPIWNKSPRLMLHHRALIQGIRFSFPVSGIADVGVEDDEWIDADASPRPASASAVRRAPVKAITIDRDKLKMFADKAIAMARRQQNWAAAYSFANNLDEASRSVVTDLIRKAEEEDRRAKLEEEGTAQVAVDAQSVELS